MNYNPNSLAVNPQFSNIQPFRSRVLAVVSGKGGVGKTNVAVNLGLSLARRGLRVALLDADLGTANVDVVLGLTLAITFSMSLLAKNRSPTSLSKALLGCK